MTSRQTGSAEGGHTPCPGVRIARAEGDLLHRALGRVAGADELNARTAATRMLEHASQHGIDLTNAWIALDEADRALASCLAVPGSGRTAMLFLSDPPRGRTPDPRAALARAACAFLGGVTGPDGRPAHTLAQALLESGEDARVGVLVDAGFLHVGELAYMRRRPAHGGSAVVGGMGRGGRASAKEARDALPEGVTIRSMETLDEGARDGVVSDVLERSYAETLDCPELCGLRATSDVLASHKGVGRYDPTLWWLLEDQGRPVGCALLTECPEQGAFELVYLGLAPEARGRGLARRLLDRGIGAAMAHKRLPITLAVDLRNAPALSLYGAAGFRRFGSRVALVRALGPGTTGAGAGVANAL